MLVAKIIIYRDYHFLLQRLAKPIRGRYYDLIGGKHEPGDGLLRYTAIREAWEEAHLTISSQRLYIHRQGDYKWLDGSISQAAIFWHALPYYFEPKNRDPHCKELVWLPRKMIDQKKLLPVAQYALQGLL